MGFKISIGNKPVHIMEGYVCIKWFEDGNERQESVKQKHPENDTNAEKMNKANVN